MVPAFPEPYTQCSNNGQDAQLLYKLKKFRKASVPKMSVVLQSAFFKLQNSGSTHNHAYPHNFYFVDFANCVSDITNNANLLHENTRQWFFEKFDKWFSGPDSRAFVLLGDAGVGKSVIAGAMAQRKRDAGELGCAFFCRNREERRNDPKNVIGTIARDLCKCINEYSKIVGGEKGVANVFKKKKELGVPDLFTQLLEEPLAQCKPPLKRLLVVIDALDETKSESREDFLHVITKGLPRLPDWLVFFITSRPEDQILNELVTNKSCIKICKGGVSQQNSFYQQHEQDIQRFLEEKVDFSRLPISVEEATKNCSGLFLCAFFTAETLTDTNNSVEVNNMSELNDLISGGIDHFFEENFCRVQKLLGARLFEKLFGCMVAAPFPLPESFITFILEREKSHLKERDVLNAVSQFVDQRTSDHTVTFLHNLIPGWLENKKKNRNFFIDPSIAGEYLKNVLTEILNAVVSQPPHRLSAMGIAHDLQTYVLHFAVRYLCKLADEDSLREVYRFLTCYTFLIKRIQLSGPGDLEECADLHNDLKLAASCFTTPKQSILEEIGDTILTHAWALQGYPNVLTFCLQITSDAVRENLWPSSCLALRSVQSEYDIGSATSFAVSSDKKLIAIGLTDRRLLFVKTATEETCGFFQLSPDIINQIHCLVFSPLDKFLFFGRIDKWFSIEDGCVKELAQFQGNSVVYPDAAMTDDGKYLLTYKDDYNLCYDIPCEHKRCLTDLLAQWALLELDNIDKMTCTFTRLSDTVSDIKIPLGKPTSELLRFLQIDSKLYKVCTEPLPYDPTICFCCLRLTELIESDTYKKSSLTAVRQLVLELYPRLFQGQVWNFDSGKPFLYDCWSQGEDIVTYHTYFTQIPGAYLWLRNCPGYRKSWSVSNISVANAVYALVMLSNFSSGNGSDSEEEGIEESGNNSEQGGIEEFD